MAKRKTPQERLEEYERQHRLLAATLADLGPATDGSLTRQMLTCGKKNCACHRDKDRRHGPYAYWTTKVKGKTVSRRLTPEEADLLEEWIANRRVLEATKRKMIALSKKMAPLVLKVRETAR